MSFVRKVAKGKLDSLAIANNGFESLKGSATLFVSVTNTDQISGTFEVSIECAKNSTLRFEPRWYKFSLKS